MKYELSTLEQLIYQLRENTTLITCKEHRQAITNEAKRTEKAIIQQLLLQKNETLLNTCFTIHLQKLIEISDQLFELTSKEIQHPGTLAILQVLGALKKAAPAFVNREIALPKAFRVIQGQQLSKAWQDRVG